MVAHRVTRLAFFRPNFFKLVGLKNFSRPFGLFLASLAGLKKFVWPFGAFYDAIVSFEGKYYYFYSIFFSATHLQKL